jgi:hypothetical protein
MINFPFTLYNDADSEVLLNAQQDALDAIPYAATMVRLDVQAFAVAPVPDDLAAAFSAANYAKKLVMINIAQQVITTNIVADYNTAYHAIYDPLYP